MLFAKLGSPASTRPASTSAAVGAAAYAALLRKCQRRKSDMGCPSVRMDGELQDHRTISSGLDRGPVCIVDPADQQETRAGGEQGQKKEPQGCERLCSLPASSTSRILSDRLTATVASSKQIDKVQGLISARLSGG